MRKLRSGRRLSAAIVGIVIIILAVFSEETALMVKAAETPVITDLEVAVSEDGSGVLARCSYQNYTEQSGCEMRLYLYKIKDGAALVESQKTLAYADQGSGSTQPKQVDEGIYQASVTIDDGAAVSQVNSLNYYRVSGSGGSYVVTEESNGKGLVQLDSETDQQKQKDASCSHECEYILIEQATPIKDAVQAYQCIKCGAVLEYMDIPNSAYAAFLKEAKCIIQNAQQEEVVIVTDRWLSFNREVFDALKMRSDLSVKVNYRYYGEEYLLVIPAGINIELLMDENGFGGFRYIEEILSQTVETE